MRAKRAAQNTILRTLPAKFIVTNERVHRNIRFNKYLREKPQDKFRFTRSALCGAIDPEHQARGKLAIITDALQNQIDARVDATMLTAISPRYSAKGVKEQLHPRLTRYAGLIHLLRKNDVAGF